MHRSRIEDSDGAAFAQQQLDDLDCRRLANIVGVAFERKTEDAKAHEYLMCIASGKTLSDQKRLKHDTEELYVKSGDEMLASLPDYLRTRAEVDRFEAGLELVLDGIERRILGAG